MTLMYNEIKDDLSLIFNGIKREDRPVASPLSALKIAIAFPALMLFSNTICWVIAYLMFVTNGDNSGLGISFYVDAAMLFMGGNGWISLAITAFLGFLFTLIFFSNALIYVSIPAETRHSSKIARHLTRNLRKLSFCLWGVASVLSAIGLIMGENILLFSFPGLIFAAIFILNGYIGIETLRYGLGPVLTQISLFINKKS